MAGGGVGDDLLRVQNCCWQWGHRHPQSLQRTPVSTSLPWPPTRPPTAEQGCRDNLTGSCGAQPGTSLAVHREGGREVLRQGGAIPSSPAPSS